MNYITAETVLLQLKWCSQSRDLEQAKHIHATVIKHGLDRDLYVASSLINAYSKCGSLVDATRVFSTMRYRDTAAWNSLIQAYAQSGQFPDRALELMMLMERQGECSANGRTYVAVLKAVVRLATAEDYSSHGILVKAISLEKGMVLHARARYANSVAGDVYVGSSLIEMYSKCGSVDDAKRVFDEMEDRDVVLWNAMMLGYVENKQADIALRLFECMDTATRSRVSRTLVAALKACTSLARDETGRDIGGTKLIKVKALEIGMALHSEALKMRAVEDIYVANCLVDMYVRCGSLADARTCFDGIQECVRDTVSWNTMLLGYVEAGKADLALKLYIDMVLSRRSKPDMWTFSCGLKASGMLSSLHQGKAIHSEIHRRGLDPDNVLLTSLLDFYGKCGSMSVAQHLFDSTSSNCLVAWNTLLEGYSQGGESNHAFQVFSQLLERGLKPDSWTFLSVLGVCNHCGLVKEGKLCFHVMSSRYGVVPNADHYHCTIDLLARANELIIKDTTAILNNVPEQGNDVTHTR